MSNTQTSEEDTEIIRPEVEDHLMIVRHVVRTTMIRAALGDRRVVATTSINSSSEAGIVTNSQQATDIVMIATEAVEVATMGPEAVMIVMEETIVMEPEETIATEEEAGDMPAVMIPMEEVVDKEEEEAVVVELEVDTVEERGLLIPTEVALPILPCLTVSHRLFMEVHPTINPTLPTADSLPSNQAATHPTLRLFRRLTTHTMLLQRSQLSHPLLRLLMRRRPQLHLKLSHRPRRFWPNCNSWCRCKTLRPTSSSNVLLIETQWLHTNKNNEPIIQPRRHFRPPARSSLTTKEKLRVYLFGHCFFDSSKVFPSKRGCDLK